MESAPPHIHHDRGNRTMTLPTLMPPDDHAGEPYSWIFTDQLGQRFRLEVYAHRPSHEQLRGGIVSVDGTGRAFLVISDDPRRDPVAGPTDHDVEDFR